MWFLQCLMMNIQEQHPQNLNIGLKSLFMLGFIIYLAPQNVDHAKLHWYFMKTDKCGIKSRKKFEKQY